MNTKSEETDPNCLIDAHGAVPPQAVSGESPSGPMFVDNQEALRSVDQFDSDAFGALLIDAASVTSPHPIEAPSDLGALRLELRLEAGRASVTWARLKTLDVGSIVEIDAAPDQRLDVLANGCRIARAMLVSVEGRAAIQIVEMGDADTSLDASAR